MSRIPSAIFTVGIFLAAWCVPGARAQITIFDNFGPNWGYNWGLGWSIAGENVPAQYGIEQAMGFVPEVGGILADVWVALAYAPPDPQVPDIIIIRLATDDNGRPGTVLEEWTFDELGSWSQWNPPLHGAGSGNARLEAGTRYWLWGLPGNDITWGLWDLNNIGDVGPHTLRREGENWLPVGNETRSVFRIDIVMLGDLDGDGDVDLFDYELFLGCYTGPEAGPPNPGCEPGDLDGDEDIDRADFALFQLAYTGGLP